MIAKRGIQPGPVLTRRMQRRGQPLVALAVLLGGWATVRVCALTLMTEPEPVTLVENVPAAPTAAMPGKVAKVARVPVTDKWQVPLSLPVGLPLAVPMDPSLAAPPAVTRPPMESASAPAPIPAPLPSARLRLAGGHQALWLAALGDIPLPPEFSRLQSKASPTPASSAPRWSADGWLMLRRGGGLAAAGAFAGNYGGSQAGAVLRYRLAPASPNKPSAYLRASAALNGSLEQEVAAGLSARLVRHVPVIAMAELRASRSGSGTRLRPAAALVTELPSLNLPAGLRAEAYAQAGYVGGSDATAFIDGQVRLDRKLFDLGRHELRAGAGAWGGAQRGASRVDVGPSAGVVLRLGDAAAARLAMDWRFRVAGRAAPASGPAITLSAGF